MNQSDTDGLPTQGEEAEAALNKEDWLIRLTAEHALLDQNGQKLSDFVQRNPSFFLLAARDQQLLRDQLTVMSTLFNILSERLVRANNPKLAAEMDKRGAVLKSEEEAEMLMNAKKGGLQ